MNQIILENLYLMLCHQGFQKDLILFQTDKYSISLLQNYEAFLIEMNKNLNNQFKSSSFNEQILTQALERKQIQTEDKIKYLKQKYFPHYLIQQQCLLGYGEHLEKGKIIIIYTGIENGIDKIGKRDCLETVQEICNLNLNIKNIMFIHSKAITSHAKDVMELYSNRFKFQVWSVSKLRKPFLSHCLMARKMQLLNKEEKKQILIKKKVTMDVLPKLSIHDPTAKYFFPNKNDCILYERDSLYGYNFNLRSVEEDLKKKEVTKKEKK